jgi:hypothetical protein
MTHILQGLSWLKIWPAPKGRYFITSCLCQERAQLCKTLVLTPHACLVIPTLQQNCPAILFHVQWQSSHTHTHTHTHTQWHNLNTSVSLQTQSKERCHTTQFLRWTNNTVHVAHSLVKKGDSKVSTHRDYSICVRRRFPGHSIGCPGPTMWPPRSSDLTPHDFYLWGHLKP